MVNNKVREYYEMSEMEYLMNSSWLPVGRKFFLKNLEKLSLKNVGFHSRNGEFLFELPKLKQLEIGPYIFRGRPRDLCVSWFYIQVSRKMFNFPVLVRC